VPRGITLSLAPRRWTVAVVLSYLPATVEAGAVVPLEAQTVPVERAVDTGVGALLIVFSTPCRRR
jgi:hypothetical protein